MANPASRRLATPGAVRLEGEQVNRLRLLRGDTPAQHFPAEARRQALDGQAVVDLLVNEAGQVVEAVVLSEAPPDQGFGLAALDTAKTFEFQNSLNKLALISMTLEFLP